MAFDNTLESLYDDLEDNNGKGGAVDQSKNDLIPDGLIDPELTDIDDLEEDYDDYTEEDSLFTSEENEEEQEEEPTHTDDDISIAENPVITELLLAKGIKDPKAIKYENEAGEIEEVDFYDLPYTDQIEILKSNISDAAPAFSEHELQVVDFLRSQNATLDDVIAYAQRQAVEDYLRENNDEGFVVDDYEDKELYLMDLKIKFDDWTEEELQLELEKELQHADLFKRKVDRIRQEYITLEAQEKEAKATELKDQEDQKFEVLSTNLIQVAVGTGDIGGITLADEDKNEVLSTLLEKDLNGVSKFIKSLDDPQTLFQVAWYAEKGKEAFDMVHDYYKKQIDEVRKSAFAKGKAESTKTAPAKTGKVNFVRTSPTKSKGKSFQSMDDLYD